MRRPRLICAYCEDTFVEYSGCYVEEMPVCGDECEQAIKAMLREREEHEE